MHLPAFRRRGFVVSALAACACVAAPRVWAQDKPEKARVVLAVGGKASFHYLPLTIAEQLGYFRAEGLDVVVQEYAAGTQLGQALASGSADLCSGAFEHTALLQSRRQMVQAFVLQGRTPQIAVGVSTRTMAQYRGLASLRGRRIGVSSSGSTTHMVARLTLARAGLGADDVRFVEVGMGSEALEALRDGALDAMSNTEPVMTMLERNGDVRVVSDTRTLKGSHDVFGGNMPAGCLYAPTAFIAQHPRTCQALANAIVHALKWLQTAGAGDIVRTVPENHLLGDRALYLASFHKVREAISPDGLIPDDGGATALRALVSVDAGLDAGRVDPSRLSTNLFARRAKERFRL